MIWFQFWTSYLRSMNTFQVTACGAECTISFTYGQKWALMELFPIFVSGLLLIGVAVSTGVELFKTKQALSSIFAKMGDVLVGGAVEMCTHCLTYRSNTNVFWLRCFYAALLHVLHRCEARVGSICLHTRRRRVL